MHVIRPLFTIGEESDGEVLDDLSVDSLDVALALGPVNDGSPLLDAHDLAGSVGELVFELRPIITGQLLGASHVKNVVFEGAGETQSCFVLELVEGDMTGENIVEDADVLPSPGCDW